MSLAAVLAADDGFQLEWDTQTRYVHVKRIAGPLALDVLLNSPAPEDRHERTDFEFITADVFAALERLKFNKRMFDLVILDPPTFSQAKGVTFTTAKDYVELVQAALQVLDQNGVLCAASNTAKLAEGEFERALGRGANAAGRELIVHQRIEQAPDFPWTPGFPESRYLKFFVGRV